jgi:hypothetical protein
MAFEVKPWLQKYVDRCNLKLTTVEDRFVVESSDLKKKRKKSRFEGGNPDLVVLDAKDAWEACFGKLDTPDTSKLPENVRAELAAIPDHVEISSHTYEDETQDSEIDDPEAGSCDEEPAPAELGETLFNDPVEVEDDGWEKPTPMSLYDPGESEELESEELINEEPLDEDEEAIDEDSGEEEELQLEPAPAQQQEPSNQPSPSRPLRRAFLDEPIVYLTDVILDHSDLPKPKKETVKRGPRRPRSKGNRLARALRAILENPGKSTAELAQIAQCTEPMIAYYHIQLKSVERIYKEFGAQNLPTVGETLSRRLSELNAENKIRNASKYGC